MAINRNGIKLSIDVNKSENRNRLIIGFENPDGSIGGSLDMTDLFFLIREYWEKNAVTKEVG